jgi:lysophospholipase L1-like esterase
VKGSTTAGAAERFEHDVISHGPDLVVIQFGINDATIDVWKNPPATHSRVAFEQYDKNLREFVRVLKLRGVRVVLMTPNPLLWTTRLVELYGHPPYDVTNAQGLNVILIHYADAVRRVAVDSATPLIDVMAAHEERRQQSAEPLLLDAMHPNQRGHELVAALLADLIVNEKLLGPARP